MLDFTSALYLGLRHTSADLGPWDALTQGRPAALREPAGAAQVAAALAQLHGCEDATLLPSTLHLFRDLFRVLAQKPVAILCDAGMYPIARWGADCAAALGVPVHTFRHHDVAALAQLARRVAGAKRRPVIVTDGFCPACGEVAPLADYAAVARRRGGYLVVDDTQALGILGASPSPAHPLGHGGGGSLAWHGLSGPHILVGSSLAKGFGSPLAVLAGSRDMVEHFRAQSDTRLHCSPPSVAAVLAAGHALAVNRGRGDALRARLTRAVTRMGRWIAAAGSPRRASIPFPVLHFSVRSERHVARVHERLLGCGIRTLLTCACSGLAVCLTFLVTALHETTAIDRAGLALNRAALAADFPLGRMVEAT